MSAKQHIKDAEYFLRLLKTKYSREEVRPLFDCIPGNNEGYLFLFA
jgi:hypothetical protein